MSTETLFRFIHAANLRLDEACEGVDDLPRELQDRLIDARLRSFEKLASTAIHERAAFVVISGGLFQSAPSNAAPAWQHQPATIRGAECVQQVCSRLAQHGISVIWSEPSDRAHKQWPREISLPKNLVTLVPEREQRLESPAGLPIIISCGNDAHSVSHSQLSPHRDANWQNPLRVAVVPTEQTPTSLPPSEIDYWAVRGCSEPAQIPAASGVAMAAGTTQGFGPQEIGIRGCVVVSIMSDRTIQTRIVETAAVHWHHEVVSIDDASRFDNLRLHLEHRTNQLQHEVAADAVLTRWTLRGHGLVFQRLSKSETASTLNAELRRDHSQQVTPAWCTDLVIEPDNIQQSRWEQDETVGGFIRELDAATAHESVIDLQRQLKLDTHEAQPQFSQVPAATFATKTRIAAIRRASRV